MRDVDSPDQASDAPLSGRSSDLVGAVINQYRFDSRIGSGGMGDVYLARDTDLDRAVAIKVLSARFGSDQQQIARFQREARSVAKLDHQHIARVWQVGRHQSPAGMIRFMVMEYVQGVDLATLLKSKARGGLEDLEAIKITLDVALALRHAHEASIVHRDIKPANILIRESDQRALVVDFGLASSIKSKDAMAFDGGLTRPGVILGTPNYLPPEQANSMNVDGRADVYALGITLYELLAGRTPFEGESLFSVIHAHVFDDLKFPPAKFAKRDQGLVRLIECMCRKRPEDRLGIEQVIAELRALLGEEKGLSDSSIINIGPSSESNIRQPATAFFGREEASEDLSEMIKKGERLITISGAVGVGKSRFAMHALPKIAREGNFGARIANLSEAKDHETLYRALAECLGVELVDDEYEKAVMHSLAFGGPCVLILDDADHLVSLLSDILGKWLQAAPNLRIVVTSREALRMGAEKLLHLAPLPFEGNDGAAIKLFLDRARSARFDFALYEGGMARVQAIVALLDGVPLAIELAAARVRTLSLAQIHKRLGKRFDVLRSAKRDGAKHQSTMQDAIRWSWEMLDPIERSALAQLSVFRAGFFLEDVEAVIDLSEEDEHAFALDVVESLAERNFLVLKEVEGIPGEIRFGMLQSIRAFALIELGIDGLVPVKDRHRAYFANLARSTQGARERFRSSEVHRRLTLHQANFEAAHESACDAGSQGDALDLGLSLEQMLALRGPWRLRRSIVRKTIELIPKENHRAHYLLSMACASGAFDRSRAEDFERYVSDAKRHFDFLSAPSALEKTNMALQSILAQDFQSKDPLIASQLEALLAETESAELGVEVRHHALGKISREIGMRYFYANQFDQAQAHFSQAAEHFRDDGDLLNRARNTSNIALCLNSMGKYREANEGFKASLEVHEAFGNRRSIARTSLNIGLAFLYLGQNRKALAWVTKAEKNYRDLGAAHGATSAMHNRALVLEGLGDAELALEILEEGEEIANVVFLGREKIGILESKAVMLIALGRMEEAITTLHGSRAHILELSEEYYLFANLCNCGIALCCLGRFDEAQEELSASLEKCRELGITHGAEEIHLWLALAELELGNFEACIKHRESAEGAMGSSGVAEPWLYFALSVISTRYHLALGALSQDDRERRLVHSKTLLENIDPQEVEGRATTRFFIDLMHQTYQN